jgi:autoinducer 2 (AI-2) kinase
MMPLVKEFEFNAGEFWDILSHCAKAALFQAGVEAGDIAGVAATSQREGCVFPMPPDARSTGPNIDSRAFAEGPRSSEIGPERLHHITGHSAPFIFPIARYLWHRKQRPERVAQILMINDWLTYRPRGARTAEPSNATESMMFDLRQRDWSQELLTKFDIPADILPKVCAPGTQVGRSLRGSGRGDRTGAGHAGLRRRRRYPVPLLGAGVIDEGGRRDSRDDDAGADGGPRAHLRSRVQSLGGCHVVPDRWVIESNAGDTGDAYLWLLRLIGGDRDLAHLFGLAEELAEADKLPSVFSYIGPAIFNMSKMRTDRPGGILFPYPLLHLRPDRGEIFRSFLDSIGYAIRGNCEQITSATSMAPARVTLSGGLSRSRALVQRIANILGLPIFAADEPESASLGCAILTAAGCGDFDDIASAAAQMVRTSEIDPTAGVHEQYAAPYAKWRELNEKLEDMSI